MSSDKDSTAHPHISVVDSEEGHKSGATPRSSSGWDGKLRVDKKLELANPEALSDPEYSDEEQVLPGEEIEADEGTYCDGIAESLLTKHQISWTITPPTLPRLTVYTLASRRSPSFVSTASKLRRGSVCARMPSPR